MLVFVGLVAVFVGWRAFGRAGVLLGFAAGVTLAVVQWSIPISSPWLWFGTVLTLMGAIGLAHIVGWSWFGRAALVLGVAATIAAAIILIPSWFGGGSGADDQQGSQATAVEERLKSVRTAVLSGFSGRSTHWSGSWRLIRDRPWFEFDSLSLSWLRPVIGYGPELFRYTYLLESPSEGRDLVPLEPDHAHNFFIHQTVEQGLLGLLSSLGLFAAVFLVGGSTLLRRGAELSLFHKLILIGLLATFAGRFLEMIFGVARVSDLTILWILLAALAAVAGTGQTSEAVPQAAVPQAAVPQAAPSRSSRRQRNRPVPGVPSRTTTATWGSFGRLAIVASLIGIIGVFTWVKGINNVRAAAEVGNAIDSFQAGDYQTALAELDRATELAPDISVYHNHKASIYMAYIINKNVPSERGCSSQSDLPYDLCLANEGLQNNREAVGQRPFYYRSVLVLANSTSSLSAYSLELEEEAVRRYEEVLALVPDSWRVRDILAEAYLNTSQPDRAIPLLKESILISQDTPLSARAYFLLGKGQGELGQLRESIVSLERALELELSNASPLNETEVLEATELLADAYVSLGRPEPAAQLFFKLGEEYWNRVTIEQSPGFVDVDREAPPSGASGENSEDIAAQVLTRSEDDLVQSSAHLERGLELGLPGDLGIQAHQTLAEVYLALGEPGMAAESLFDLGGIYHNQGDLEEAVRYLERSLEVAPSSALADQAHQALAEVYTSRGRIDEAAMHRQDGRP